MPIPCSIQNPIKSPKIRLLFFWGEELLLYVGMALLVALVSAAELTADQVLPQIPRFTEAPCPCDVPPEIQSRIQCGYLTVPENRSRSQGRTLRIAVAILRSTNPHPAPDPVVYLEGGPGGGTLAELTAWVDTPLLRDRDLVLFDQRGSGFSEPDLWCSEIDDAGYALLAEPISPDRRRAVLVRAAEACASRLTREGVDLTCYNTAAIAADVEDLRLALGYARWNLFGVSYGTRVALVTLRDYPQGIRSVVLDSCVPLEAQEYEEAPLNADRAFQRFFQECRENGPCQRTFPDLEQTFFRLVLRMNATPLSLEVPVAGAGEREDLALMRFSGNDLMAILFQLLYDDTVIPYIPLLIDRIRQGDYAALARIAGEHLVGGGGDGMYFCVECRDEALFNWPDDVAAALDRLPSERRYNPYPYDLDICRIWPAGDVSQRESSSVRSPIPALVLAGGFDPITPPTWSQAVARELPNAFYIEFPYLGHGVSTSACGSESIAAFLRNPLRSPTPGCLLRNVPPVFVLDRTEHDSPYGIADAVAPPSRGLLDTVVDFLRNTVYQEP